MTAERSILAVKYTAVAATPDLRRAVGGFLRYVQYRDHHETATGNEVGGLLKYVAYRDRAAAQGRLFDRHGPAGDEQRKRLGAFVVRSVRGLSSTSESRRPERAVYRFVLSPERADGLDLRELTRATMGQLELDAGAEGLPPWIAAEHRNTAHPHVHIVMAARREVSPEQFRTLLLTRDRLARMKVAMHLDLARQRGGRPQDLEQLRAYTRTLGPNTSHPQRRSARRYPSLWLVLRLTSRRYAQRLKWEELELERSRRRGRER